MYGAGFRSLRISSERNPSKHSRMKRNLSSAFSTKALAEQEGIVAANIDNFIDRWGKDGEAETGGLDISEWYEMAAFDSLGDMAFGRSFGSVDSGSFTLMLSLVLCGYSM